MTKVVLVDFDGVLVNLFSRLSVTDFCTAYGVNFAKFLQAAKKSSEGLDVGQKTESEYFAELIELLALKCNLAELQKFFIEADARNLQKNEQLYQWVGQVSQRGILVALATNVSRELAGRLEERGLYNYFQRCYFSYEMGLAKPEKQFYEYIIKDLSIAPSKIILVDDKQENIDSASSAGLEGVIYYYGDPIPDNLTLMTLSDK